MAKDLVRGREWRHDKWLQFTTRAVCKRCNGGWLAALEAEAKPVLSPLILGEPEKQTLSQQQQRVLATWAVKTIMIFATVAPKLKVVIPDWEYRRFYDDRKPLKTVVWLAAYMGDDLAASAKSVNLVLDADAYLTLLQVGRALFVLFDYFGEKSIEVTFHKEFASAMEGIWPPRDTPVSWPSQGQAFSSLGLEQFQPDATFRM